MHPGVIGAKLTLRLIFADLGAARHKFPPDLSAKRHRAPDLRLLRMRNLGCGDAERNPLSRNNVACHPWPMGAFVYILRCADGSYYVGSTRDTSVERRVSEHTMGMNPASYTFRRRPVTLVFSEEFQQITDAIAAERRIKGWTRAKKEALIRGDWARVSQLAKRSSARAKPNSET
jgi:putative endonuclease